MEEKPLGQALFISKETGKQIRLDLAAPIEPWPTKEKEKGDIYIIPKSCILEWPRFNVEEGTSEGSFQFAKGTKWRRLGEEIIETKITMEYQEGRFSRMMNYTAMIRFEYNSYCLTSFAKYALDGDYAFIVKHRGKQYVFGYGCFKAILTADFPAIYGGPCIKIEQLCTFPLPKYSGNLEEESELYMEPVILTRKIEIRTKLKKKDFEKLFMPKKLKLPRKLKKAFKHIVVMTPVLVLQNKSSNTYKVVGTEYFGTKDGYPYTKMVRKAINMAKKEREEFYKYCTVTLDRCYIQTKKGETL